MVKETVNVDKYTCDACGKVVFAHTVDDLLGIVGEAFEYTSSSGGGADWYACSRKCVGKAVATALDKAWND